MKAAKLLLSLVFTGAGLIGMAQSANSGPIHAYVVGNVGADKVVVSDVVVSTFDATNASIIKAAKSNTPRVASAKNAEVRRFGTAEEATRDRAELLQKYETTGLKVLNKK